MDAPPESNVILPESVIAPLQLWEVLAVADDVICCEIGDHVLILPGSNFLGVDDIQKIGLLHENSIIAIVQPPTNIVGLS